MNRPIEAQGVLAFRAVGFDQLNPNVGRYLQVTKVARIDGPIAAR